jgi:hypothetical protein
MLSSTNTIELLKNVEKQHLYLKLVEQLNKDFHLSNLKVVFETTILPIDLKEQLAAVLLNLINQQYDDYLNFIYRVDVSEKELLNIKETNLPDLVEQITFLVLKRTIQKVWLKKNY